MANKALRWSLAMFRARFVTVGTGGLTVFADEPEISEVVLKRRLVELHNIGIAAFMIGMARSAALVEGAIMHAVEATSTVNIGCNFFVAVEAKRALLGTLEGLVTETAFGFVVRMTLDYVARHDQRFNLGRGSLGNHKNHRHRNSSQ
jgi:hypothetical protein